MRHRAHLLSAVLLGACLLAGAAHADDAADIRAVLAAQTAAWNRGDIPGFMAGYWHSPQLRFASGGTITHGWQPTLERYQRRYPDSSAMGTLTFTLHEINVLAPDAAVVFGRWELARAQDRPWGLFTLVLRKTSAGWRVTADHTSSAEP